MQLFQLEEAAFSSNKLLALRERTGETQTHTKRFCDAAVAGQTERADILKVAFATAFRYGKNVVRIPEALAGNPFQPPVLEQSGPPAAARAQELTICLDGIDHAKGADAAIASKDLMPQVPWIGAQTPFVNAPGRAECSAAPWNFE